MGTADYIAPEQAADPRTADIRADIYALGCTLFHLLTGGPPFPNGTATEKLAHHASTPLPALSAVRPDAPAGLTAVLARMTAKDPAGRYTTSAEVAEALAPFSLADGPRLRPARRRLVVAALVGLTFIGLLTFALVSRFNTDHGGDMTRTGDTNPDSAPDPIAVATPEITEEAAVQAVEKLGGKIARNDRLPNKPVTSINLADAGLTDADLRAVAACKQLRTLHLERTPITDAGLKQLRGLTQLMTLVIPRTGVSDAGMEYVGELKQLVSLEIMQTRVGDAGIKHLVGLTQLRTLVLRGTQVTDAGLADVGRLSNLRFLSLDETAITGGGLKYLTPLPELENLSLNAAQGR